MSSDLPDETSRLYRYVKQLDRRITTLRHKASSRQPVLSMTWFVLISLLLIPAVAVVIFLTYRTHTQYVLLTGPAGSTTARLAPRLQAILNEPTPLERWLHLNIIPDFELLPSCGALDTIAQMNAGVAHLGFAEDGLPEAPAASIHCPMSSERMPPTTRAAETDAKVRVLTLLYKSPLHVITRTKLGFKDLHDLTPGTKVYLGPDGSATSFVSQRIVDHYGLRLERHGPTLDFDQAAQGLTDGKFDVAFFLMGLQTDVLRTLLQRNGEFQLLPIGQAASLKMLFPYLETLTIPAAMYPNAPGEIQTVATNTVLVASTVLGESEVYEVTKKVAEHVQDLLRDVPLNLARVIDNDPAKDVFYPIHDGAHRFFAHNPPLFVNLLTLTGIGTYFSLVYASYAMMLQFLRHYRVHRLLMTVDLILERVQRLGNSSDPTRPIAHLQKIKRTALRLMRRRKVTYEEFSRIEDYIKAHHL